MGRRCGAWETGCLDDREVEGGGVVVVSRGVVEQGL